MRTATIAIALSAVLNLLGCAGSYPAARGGPCAIETSEECQMERTSKVPQ